jgi:hypothetical protein
MDTSTGKIYENLEEAKLDGVKEENLIPINPELKQCSIFKTMRHIETVRNFLDVCADELIERGEQHDQSKLQSPELEIFDIITPKLRGLTYGSEEYKAVLREQKPAIEHHYKHNSHHPEYYENQIQGMSLFDLVEMICDWKAATLRHNDGDIRKSIEINQKRFGFSDELKNILINTINEIEQWGILHYAKES